MVRRPLTMEAWKNMDPYDTEDRDRRRRTPIDPTKNDDFFKDIMNDDQLMGDIRKMAEEMMKLFSNAQPGKSVVHGFKVQFGPDGRPHIEGFGNRPSRAKGCAVVSEEIEPLTDVIEEEDTVSVTVEIPGVEKSDISLTANDSTLEIGVDSPKRKYHKTVKLPCPVKSKSTRATYRNGVLDIVLDKKEQRKDEDGYRVNIR